MRKKRHEYAKKSRKSVTDSIQISEFEWKKPEKKRNIWICMTCYHCLRIFSVYNWNKIII